MQLEEDTFSRVSPAASWTCPQVSYCPRSDLGSASGEPARDVSLCCPYTCKAAGDAQCAEDPLGLRGCCPHHGSDRQGRTQLATRNPRTVQACCHGTGRHGV